MSNSAPSRSILLVDDDLVFRERLVKAFNARSFLTLSAESFQEACQVISKHTPEFAVIDLRLGNDSGISLLTYLLEINPEVKAIVITGYGSIATAIEAVKIGAINYLTKPVDISQILLALELPESLRTDTRVSAKHAGITKVSQCVPSLEQVEWEHIQRVLNDCEGNVSRAAKMLGLHRRSLQRKLLRAPE